MRSTRSDKELAERLGSVPLFAATSTRQRRALAKIGKQMSWKEGQEAISEGSKGAAFFLLLDGGVQVSRGGSPVARLGGGDFVGEMALLTKEPRNATVTATQDTTVFALGRPAFTAAIKDDPSLAITILEALAKRQTANH